MKSAIVEQYIKKKYTQSKTMDLKHGDVVLAVYLPYGKKSTKNFKGKVIKIKNKQHLTTVTVRSLSDDLHKTIEITLPFYKDDVNFTLINRKISHKQKAKISN